MTYKKKLGGLIILSTLVRILLASTLELGNDEVYYQTYAKWLQWNYFDHPPMVALLIRMTTFNQFFHHEFFVRLGPMLCAGLGTWLIFKIGQKAGNDRTGWIAALLYNTSFFTSVISGVFILPDSPQVIFWLLSILLMITTLKDERSQGHQGGIFVLLGITIGLCTMSKVHGIFLLLGFGAYILFHRSELLKNPWLWVTGLISLAILSPIYFWNISNDFITYKYHQGRIHFWGSSPDMDHLLQQVLGSVFYNNPINFVLYMFVLYQVSKRNIKGLPAYYPLLLWLSLPLIVVLIWTALFNDTLPHWSGPGYLTLMILSACYLECNTKNIAINKWLRTSVWVYIGVVFSGWLAILFAPFRIGSDNEMYLGKGDVSLDMTGWSKFSKDLDSLYTKDKRSGRMKPGAILISDYWFPAGHIDYYYCLPFHRNQLVWGALNDIHHFAWVNERSPRLLVGSDAYFIYPSNYYGPPKQSLRNAFGSVDDSLRIPQIRSGNTVRYFVIYRMHDFRGDSLNYLIRGIR